MREIRARVMSYERKRLDDYLHNYKDDLLMAHACNKNNRMNNEKDNTFRLGVECSKPCERKGRRKTGGSALRRGNNARILRNMSIGVYILFVVLDVMGVSRWGVWGKADLPLGDVNVLVVTDVHSWVAGHMPHEPNLNVDYGHVLSFYKRLKEDCDSLRRDLFFVMNGDFMDGTGLSKQPPRELISILRQMPWDAINVGNHDLYENSTIEFLTDPNDGIIPTTSLDNTQDDPTSPKNNEDKDNRGYNLDPRNKTRQEAPDPPTHPETNAPRFKPYATNWKDTYITSNVRLASNNQTMGKRYRYLHAPHADANILTFGFLYDMKDNSPLTVVETVESVVQSDWFIQVLSSNNLHIDETDDDHKHFDAILVLAHMHVVDPLIQIISKAIRDICGPFMPLQFVTGHTHIRKYQVIDHFSSSFEAGRYLDTLGFISFPTNRTVTRSINEELANNPNFTVEFFSQPTPFPPPPLPNNNQTIDYTNCTHNNNNTIMENSTFTNCTLHNNTNTTQPIDNTNTTQPINNTNTTQPIDDTNTTQPINNTNTTQPIDDINTNTTFSNSTDSTLNHTSSTNSTLNLNLTNITDTSDNQTNETDHNTNQTTPKHTNIPTMSPKTATQRSIAKANLTIRLFQHEFIDANTATLERKLNGPRLETAEGNALTMFINKTQNQLGLFRILGCADRTYVVDKDIRHGDSLWNLYTNVIKNGLLKQNTSKIFIQSSGSLRYNIFEGRVTVTDLISASPFNDTIWVVAERVKGSDFSQVIDTLNQVDKIRFHSNLPHYVVADTGKILSNSYYDIYTAEYDRYYVQKSIVAVTNSTMHNPLLYQNGMITTGTLWDNYLNTSLSCPIEEEKEIIVPTFFKSVGQFFKELTWWKALAMAITMVLFCCFACFFIGPIDICDEKFRSSKHHEVDLSISSSDASSRYFDDGRYYDSSDMGISPVQSDDMQSIGTINSFA